MMDVVAAVIMVVIVIGFMSGHNNPLGRFAG
jgi:hypothetical protein